MANDYSKPGQLENAKRHNQNQREKLTEEGFRQTAFWTTKDIATVMRKVAERQRNGELTEQQVIDALKPLSGLVPFK